MSTRMKNTKMFALRVDEALYSYLKSRKSSHWRDVLRKFRDGKLVDIADIDMAKTSQGIPVQIEDEPKSVPIIENKSSRPAICIYCAEDPKDPLNYLYCGTKRIPISVCEKRRARYQHYERRCKPVKTEKRSRRRPVEIPRQRASYPTRNAREVQDVRAKAVQRLDVDSMICPDSPVNYKRWITREDEYKLYCLGCFKSHSCPIYEKWTKQIQ